VPITLQFLKSVSLTRRQMFVLQVDDVASCNVYLVFET